MSEPRDRSIVCHLGTETAIRVDKTYLDVMNKQEHILLCTKLRSNKDPRGFLHLIFKVHKVPLKKHPVVL